MEWMMMFRLFQCLFRVVNIVLIWLLLVMLQGKYSFGCEFQLLVNFFIWFLSLLFWQVKVSLVFFWCMVVVMLEVMESLLVILMIRVCFFVRNFIVCFLFVIQFFVFVGVMKVVFSNCCVQGCCGEVKIVLVLFCFIILLC